ncbi:hypothetical protein GCM10023189_53110 [Nibrella saemangeumensis]|uniref:Capsule assembly protein Wzi n=1 Tax=Nibrella saemangeumensis TaxID=1084526 RepID=A0ABP8NM75_9BACT
MKYNVYHSLLLLLSIAAQAQSPFVPLNPDYYHWVDRMEIRQGRWAEGFHSSMKPYNRQGIVRLTDSVEANLRYPLSRTDFFNLRYLRDDSWEWVTDKDSANRNTITRVFPGDSQRPFLGTFYQKKADFYSVQTPDFDLHVNPVFYYSTGTESNNNNRLFVNTRGVEVRGSIAKRLGFYSFFSDNQAVFPRYIQEYGQLYGIPDGGFAPGEGFAKQYRQTGADFLSARGYITFNILKIINFQFGHDRNFIGNGYRSLFLSDNSAPYLFMKLTTTFGRFQYTNLFSELQNTSVRRTSQNDPITQKFTSIHHLSMNLGDNINLGLFEAEVFSRDRFDINYLNPIIFYRYVESFRGSADNAMIGIDFKANFRRHFLVYSQFLIDEFLISELSAGRGSWTNKFAAQAGVKYIDALGVPNLDLQAEMNLARPYTYSHKSGQTNYVHYSQPLAHPLGANFVEGLGIVRYQHRQFNGVGTFGIMMYGTDQPYRNYGGDITKNYETRVRNDGNYIGQGRQTAVTYADLRLSYMFKHNVFLEGRYLFRFQDSQYTPLAYTTQQGSVALRWNLPYRGWTF